MTLKARRKALQDRREELEVEVYELWKEEVQALADRFNTEIATGHCSDTWQAWDRRRQCFQSMFEYGNRIPRILTALEALDSAYEALNIGPRNGMRIYPKLSGKKSDW